MIDYPALKTIHMILALASGLGFALRGFIRLVLHRPLANRFWRVAPHLVDTLLLVSGFALWFTTGWPLVSWLGVKLLAILAYILLGMAAFRSERPGRAAGLYVLALLVFLSIAALALYKPL